jgi:hypothetical protein
MMDDEQAKCRDLEARQTQRSCVVVARRPNSGADLTAVCNGIGIGLRMLLSDVPRETIPNGMAELLKHLICRTQAFLKIDGPCSGAGACKTC